MSQLGILNSFDHNSQCWQTFKGRINQWFIANDVEKNDTKKRAILLSTLSDGTYKLAADLALPKEIQNVPYEDIIKLLDDHFIPKKTGFGERYNFYSAVQNLGETYPQWAARLRGLTANCSFSNVEEALRDRFLMGMLPGPERDKVFTQGLADLTLAKAVELADTVRCARAVAAAAPGPQPQQQDNQLFKIASSSKSASVQKVQCKVCGLKNHETEQCRYSKFRCKKCNVKGHLRRMCTKINYIENEGTLDGNDDDGKLFNIRSVNGKPMTEQVSVQGVMLEFQIDSGSAVTAISELTYKQYFSNVPLTLTAKRLLSYTGDSISCIGITRLQFVYRESTHTLNVYVIRNGGPPLLGRDFISLFKLELIPVNYCEQNDPIINELQDKYASVFSDELGKFNKYKVSIQLKENTKPIFFKARPIAFALKDKINDEIDRLLRVGILKQVDYSEYASPVVPVLKSKGQIRLCADYSVSINKHLKIDQYPLPTAQDLFTKLHGGIQFSKIDLKQAYAQVELDSESQQYTCINTHRGLFAYTRLVYGLASAPAVFQRVMDCLLAGLDGVLCLLDDVLVTGSTKEQHLQRLNTVLSRLQDVGLTLQKEKCEFFKDEVEYLGYIIDKNGLRKSPKKVEAILSAPVPTNVTKLQSFLGLINYYRNFVPGASSLLSPLYNLLHKDSKWCWTTEHDNAFNKIKQLLASDKVLAHFNPQATLILTVDASSNGLGAILSQIDDSGEERPISFASRTLNKAEQRYAQIQKEATAIIFGVRRFHQYLYGRSVPFVLRTDHKPLISIFGPYKGIPEISANRLQRYALFLSAYNYSIEYIKSADNSADYLSRASLPETETESHEGARQTACAGAAAAARSVVINDDAAYVNFVIDSSLPVTRSILQKETGQDNVLTRVIHYILNGWPPKITEPELKQYFCCRTELSYESGCIMRGHKVVIPNSLQDSVLAELHKSHLGIVKCKAEARSRFWFPGIDKAIDKMIASCDVCLQLRATPARAPLAVWTYPPHPFYRIHIDFLGPINNETYLVIVDAYSKWVEAIRMSTVSTAAVILKLQQFMSTFGVCHTLVSDNAMTFVSQEFEAFCAANGISHLTSPTYHPASNGQAESFVKIIKKGIKSSILSNDSKPINLKIMKYLFDYRNSIHTTTGLSPAELVFGRKLRSRLDLIAPPAPPVTSSSQPSALSDHVRKQQCLQSESYNGHNEQTYGEGQIVLYKKPIANKQHRWIKAVVIKRIGNVIYLIKDLVTSVTLKKHKNQLLMYNGTDNSCDSQTGMPTIEIEDIVTPQSATLEPAREPPPPATECTSSSVTGETQSASGTPPETHSVVADSNLRSDDDEEFQEAIDSESEPDTAVEGRRVGGRVLRAIPRVNYKPYM